MATQVKAAAWLEWMERLAATPVAHVENELPRSLFHCRLDDQPDHLVPEHLLRPGHWEVPSDRPLFVNPNCFFTRGGDLPSCAPAEAFATQGVIAWITDPATDALQPFWLGLKFDEQFSGAQPGDPAPSQLSPGARHALSLANLFVPDDHVSSRRAEWAKIVSSTSAQFQQQGYAPVASLIHPFHIAALRRYYRQQLRTGKLHLGDAQSPRRYIAHNDPVARFFHHQLTGAMTAIAGEPLKPSYVYMASYQPGATLEKHTDRAQCKFSMTLCLDYSPEPRHATPWPLHLHKPSGMATVYQAIGDALLYRGCRLPHSRNPLPEGNTSTSIFFHYVRQDFTGSLD
jgi:hypothetical protein